MTVSSAKLIWFTDPQLIPAGRINYDIDPLARLDACLERIGQEHPDADGCVTTGDGDLTHWGEESAYQLLAERLSSLDCPVYLIPGNHDDRSLLLSHFPDLPVTAGDYVSSPLLLVMLILSFWIRWMMANGAAGFVRQD